MTIPAARRRAHHAFTLVEIMIVLVIIGLLAALALPAFNTVRRRAQATRMVAAWKVIAHAAIVYNTENADWPADRMPGVKPPELTHAIEDTIWQNPAVAGAWDWEYRSVSSVKAGISFHPDSMDTELFELIDARMDDGNLATGDFRRVNAGKCTYIIERD